MNLSKYFYYSAKNFIEYNYLIFLQKFSIIYRYTEVHTPFTIRAKELMEIYNGLKMKKLTIDERYL
jgi:hypothetical protein